MAAVDVRQFVHECRVLRLVGEVPVQLDNQCCRCARTEVNLLAIGKLAAHAAGERGTEIGLKNGYLVGFRMPPSPFENPARELAMSPKQVGHVCRKVRANRVDDVVDELDRSKCFQRDERKRIAFDCAAKALPSSHRCDMCHAWSLKMKQQAIVRADRGQSR